jgi:K(+)-stimulated pyrophosphate-energized sodium pump
MYALWEGGLVGALIGGISIVVALLLYRRILRQDPGTERMQTIAQFIEEGARAYLFRQNVTLFLFLGVLAPIIGILFGLSGGASRGLAAALAYLLGAGCSTAAASFGMIAAVRANVRTASAAQKGLKPAFATAYFGGAVMGLGIVGLALLGISLAYYVCRYVLGWSEAWATSTVLGFSFGASALALFRESRGRNLHENRGHQRGSGGKGGAGHTRG